MRVSIVIPVGKEGPDLFDRVSFFKRSLLALSEVGGTRIDVEIVLVSDVFDLETVKAMIALSRSGIARCYLLTQRVGKGGSIKNVIGLIKGDYVITLDADIPVSADFLYRVLEVTRKSDLDLLVVRRIYRNNTNVFRTLLSISYNSLANLFFRTGIWDHQAGLKVFSRRAALLLFRLSSSDDLGYDTEVIVLAKRFKLRMAVAPSLWLEKRDRSTIGILRAILTMLIDLLVLRLLCARTRNDAVKKVVIGKVIDLSNLCEVRPELATAIRVTGIRGHFIKPLRWLYVISLRRG